MKKLISSVVFLMLIFSLFSCSDSDKTGTAGINEPSMVTLPASRIDLYVGQKHLLTPSVLPMDAKNTKLTWNSSRSEVCSVDDGIIMALSEGISVVTVKTDNGKSASVRVQVRKLEDISAILLSDLEVSLEPGHSHLLSASLFPKTDSSKLPIVWSTSDDTVAVVDSYGRVTAIGEGACLISAEVANVARAVCKVYVGEGEIDLSSIVSVTVEGVPKSYETNSVKAEITSYEVQRELTDNGKIKVVVRIYGTKTFDKDDTGDILGKNPIKINKAVLYEMLPESEKQMAYYVCSSGELASGEDFEFSVSSHFYPGDSTPYYTPENELAFEVAISPEQRHFKIILNYGEEVIADELN